MFVTTYWSCPSDDFELFLILNCSTYRQAEVLQQPHWTKRDTPYLLWWNWYTPLAWPLGETGVRSPTTHLDEIGIPLPPKHRNQNGGNNIFARMRWERCRVTSVHNKFLLNNILIETKSSRFSMSLPLFCLPWKVNKQWVRHSEVDKIQNDLVSYSIHSIKTYLNQLPWTFPDTANPVISDSVIYSLYWPLASVN